MTRMLTIHLARGEYGNELMATVAGETLRADLADIVTVHEHGGWWLQYARDHDGQILIVGTANDAAVQSHPQQRLRDRLNAEIRAGTPEWLPEIRRENNKSEIRA